MAETIEQSESKEPDHVYLGGPPAASNGSQPRWQSKIPPGKGAYVDEGLPTPWEVIAEVWRDWRAKRSVKS